MLMSLNYDVITSRLHVLELTIGVMHIVYMVWPCANTEVKDLCKPCANSMCEFEGQGLHKCLPHLC